MEASFMLPWHCRLKAILILGRGEGKCVGKARKGKPLTFSLFPSLPHSLFLLFLTFPTPLAREPLQGRELGNYWNIVLPVTSMCNTMIRRKILPRRIIYSAEMSEKKTFWKVYVQLLNSGHVIMLYEKITGQVKSICNLLQVSLIILLLRVYMTKQRVANFNKIRASHNTYSYFEQCYFFINSRICTYVF